MLSQHFNMFLAIYKLLCTMKQNGNFRSIALFYNYYNIYDIVSDLMFTIYNS